MAVSVDQIDLWRSVDSETEVLEFKAASNQFSTDKLYEYCVAIGNEGGGYLILGIQNQKPRSVVSSRAIENPIGMCEKVFNKLNFRIDIEVVNHPAGRVVVVCIPGCAKGHPFHLDGRYLMRVGESVQPMSPDRLRRMFAEVRSDWLEEHTKARLGPGQVLDLLDARLYFDLSNIPTSSTVGGVIEKLLVLLSHKTTF